MALYYARAAMARPPLDPQALGGPERARRALDGLERHAGAQPGFRRAHARGLGFRGHFVATPAVAELTTAEHLQGERVETVVRLSNGSANPYAPDRSSVLGLGVRFALPSGGESFWGALNITAFPAQRPEDFIALTAAQRRNAKGRLNPLRLAAHVARHAGTLGGLLAILRVQTRPSFADTTFNGLHAYHLVAADGSRRAVRYRWLPEHDRGGLSAEQERRYPPQYLLSEMRRRVARGPVRWTLELQLAEPGDPTHDQTRAWPDERPRIAAGELVVERVHDDPGYVDGLNFDPTVVPPGIELSDDPILHFRSTVYAESRRRRGAEQRPDVEPE